MPLSPSPILSHIRTFTATLIALIALPCCSTTNSLSTLRPGTAAGHLSPDNLPINATAQGIRTHPLIPVIRDSRYTLVELSPSAEQQDLMRQIVDITMPATFTISVGDALRYLLLRSGFALCTNAEIHILDTLPLPAADFHVGPTTLETALRLLVGPAWRLEVNELTRKVCFSPFSPTSPIGSSGIFPPTSTANPSKALRSTVVGTREGSR